MSKETRYKIIIILLSVFVFVIPLCINPFVVENYPKPLWDNYVLAFVVFPVLAWFVLGFAIKKMKEQDNHPNDY